MADNDERLEHWCTAILEARSLAEKARELEESAVELAKRRMIRLDLKEYKAAGLTLTLVQTDDWVRVE